MVEGQINGKGWRSHPKPASKCRKAPKRPWYIA